MFGVKHGVVVVAVVGALPAGGFGEGVFVIEQVEGDGLLAFAQDVAASIGFAEEQGVQGGVVRVGGGDGATGVAGDGGRLDDGMVFRLAHGGVAVAAFDQGGRGAGALLVFVHFQQGGSRACAGQRPGVAVGSEGDVAGVDDGVKHGGGLRRVEVGVGGVAAFFQGEGAEARAIEEEFAAAGQGGLVFPEVVGDGEAGVDNGISTRFAGNADGDGALVICFLVAGGAAGAVIFADELPVFVFETAIVGGGEGDERGGRKQGEDLA